MRCFKVAAELTGLAIVMQLRPWALSLNSQTPCPSGCWNQEPVLDTETERPLYPGTTGTGR